MRHIILIFALVSLSPSAVLCDDPLKDAERAFIATNSKVDEVFQRLIADLKQLDPKVSPNAQRTVELLMHSQLVWQEYREAQANCEANDTTGGRNPAYKIEYLRAATRIAKERLEYLHKISAEMPICLGAPKPAAK